jgi:DNA-binding MarR family transcriptional regulator
MFLRNWRRPTGELARRISFGDSTISGVSRNLQRAGLVARWAHQTDGRKAMVGLTPKGLKLIQEILPQRARLVRARMCVLARAQQENLQRICLRLAEGDDAKFAIAMTTALATVER